MAYLPKQIPDEEKNLFGRQDDTTANPIPPQTGGSSGTGSEGTGATNAAPGMATSTQFGSNAAKLSDYLKSNAPQIQEFGNKISGNLTENYNKTMGDINQGFGNFNQQVNQGYAQPNQEKINQAISNPVSYAQNPDDVKSFQSWYNNEYTGPQNFEGTDTYAGLNNQVNQAVEKASLVGNESGLNTYLNQFTGNPGRTKGMQTLDTALLQRNPEAAQSIRAAAQPYSGLNDYLGGKVNEANKNVQTAKQATNDTRENLRNQFTGEGGFVPNFQNEVNARVSQSQGDAAARAAAAKNMFTDVNLTMPGAYKNINPQILSDLGITDPIQAAVFASQQSGYNHLGGNQYSNPLGYLNQRTPEVELNKYNLSTPDDFARAQALSQLTGTENYLPGEYANQAGTGNLDMSDFDANKVFQEIQNNFQVGNPNKQINWERYLDSFKTSVKPPDRKPGTPGAL